MSSSEFETPIRLERRPSRYHFGVTVITHCLALIAIVYPVALPVIVKLLLVGMLFLSFGYHINKLTKQLPIWIWYPAGRWCLHMHEFEQDWVLSGIQSNTYWFAIFRLSNDRGQNQDVLVLRDQVDKQTYRRLRVRLRFSQVEAAIPGETI